MKNFSTKLLIIALLIIVSAVSFFVGTRYASSCWRKDLVRLGSFIVDKNAGIELNNEMEWPNKYPLLCSQKDSTTVVYMGVLADTEVLLAFKKEKLINLNYNDYFNDN